MSSISIVCVTPPDLWSMPGCVLLLRDRGEWGYATLLPGSRGGEKQLLVL